MGLDELLRGELLLRKGSRKISRGGKTKAGWIQKKASLACPHPVNSTP
jgi:hypothetical protein